MNFKRMTDLDLKGKRVLIREDLNVPVKDGKVIIYRADVGGPVGPDVRRLVCQRDHFGLRVEAANDGGRGGGGAVTDVSVSVDHIDGESTARQIERDGTSHDAAADDRNSHGTPHLPVTITSTALTRNP